MARVDFSRALRPARRVSLRVWVLVMVLAAACASLLVLSVGVEPGNAALSGTNGKIAFTSGTDGNREIYVMDPDGSNQTRLTNDLADDSNPVFSPDGNKITFWSDRDGDREIYVMDSDGSNQTRLTNNPGDDSNPSWGIAP